MSLKEELCLCSCLNTQVQLVGLLQGDLKRGPGHDQEKDLTPKAADNIFLAHLVLDQLDQGAQQIISGIVAKGVMVFLEMVQISMITPRGVPERLFLLNSRSKVSSR